MCYSKGKAVYLLSFVLFPLGCAKLIKRYLVTGGKAELTGARRGVVALLGVRLRVTLPIKHPGAR